MNDRIILEAKHVRKVFRTGPQVLEVLKDVNLRIEKGQIAGIFGPSGSGKSTLLHILGSLEPPTDGEVRLLGKSYLTMDDKALSELRNRDIGFVFQFHHLLPEFTALENVALPAIIGGKPRKEAMEKAEELLVLVGLKERLKHRPDELSGGERQRVAVARALINGPKILLADEPTGNLDSKNALSLLELFRDLNENLGTTMLIVTHNEKYRELTHRNYRLEDGRLLDITGQKHEG